MPAELPSTEEIVTETNCLVPMLSLANMRLKFPCLHLPCIRVINIVYSIPLKL